ncbi:MAG: PH domain-containing protein [Oscillospiraceae bacterium]
MKHQHPYKILQLASKNFWLLLIPLVRGLVALRFDFFHWVKGAWLDLVVILFIGISAYLRWYFSTFEVAHNCLHCRFGVFARSDVSIPFSSICAVSSEKKFFLRPLKIVSIYLDTNSGIFPDADVKLSIRQSDYEKLFSSVEKLLKPESPTAAYLPSKVNLWLFSFIFSSTLSGVLFISTLLIESGKIVGNSLQEQLMTAVTDVTARLAIGLPPLAVAISLIIFGGWLISFVSNILRYIGFKIVRTGRYISIRNGIFTLRHYLINANKINYADFRQNLLTKIFQVMSVHVDCSGYGKAKNELPVFVPITTKHQVESSLKLLLPSIKLSESVLTPQWNTYFRFCFRPFFAIILIPVAALFMHYYFPNWSSIIDFASLMAEVPMIWLLTAKSASYFNTGISATDKTLCLKYSFGFAFHTVVVPKEKIAKITVMQNIFQMPMQTCDICVYTTNEFSKRHTILSLPLPELLAFLDKEDLTPKITIE